MKKGDRPREIAQSQQTFLTPSIWYVSSVTISNPQYEHQLVPYMKENGVQTPWKRFKVKITCEEVAALSSHECVRKTDGDDVLTFQHPIILAYDPQSLKLSLAFICVSLCLCFFQLVSQIDCKSQSSVCWTLWCNERCKAVKVC